MNTKYIMPAEWEKHEGIWLAWPHDEITFPPLHIAKVKNTYIEILKNLTPTEQVFLLVLDEKMQKEVSDLVIKNNIDISKITFHVTEYADVWLRDYGPMFVFDSEQKLSWIKWQYDAYSKKFPDLMKDNQVFHNLKNTLSCPMLESSMVLEGGSIEQNGLGTLITTEQCLLESGRNPNLDKGQIENNLRELLGATNIIWLKNGLKGDHTDGHVDDIAKFVSADTILVAYEEDLGGENYEILKQNFTDLEKAVDQNGKPFKIIKLQIPHLRYDMDKSFEAGNIAPASYTNFYIGNNVVLVPIYNDPNDQKALDTISYFFPDRKVVSIDCTDLIYGGGAIHCMSQQQPL